MAAQSMAKVRLRMFRIALPAVPKVVHPWSRHPALPSIRLGRWYPPSLEDFRSGLHLFVRGWPHICDPANDSYYAIACALALSLLNWALVGLFADQLDLFYLESWQVFLTCIVIFSGLSNISSAIFMYRLNADSLGNALINNFKVSESAQTWLTAVGHFLLLLLLWSVLALVNCPVSPIEVVVACSDPSLAHLTGYNMQWASTVKEVELSHFFKEWPAMWKRFWDIWVVSWVIILGVGMMASPLVPYGYRITNFTCILPIMTQACCHFLYPIVLNPWCKSYGWDRSSWNRADSQCCSSSSRQFHFWVQSFIFHYRHMHRNTKKNESDTTNEGRGV